MIKQSWKFILLSSLLSACGDSEATKDVAYYLKHRQERLKKRAQCLENYEELKDTINCQNALKAEEHDDSLPKNIKMPRVRSKRFGDLTKQQESTSSQDGS